MQTADILIIGGGMAGISAGAMMAAEAKVHVLEAEPMTGYHSTGRSAAIFIRNYGNATLRALNALSVDFFETPEGVSDRSLLTARGELLLAREDELDVLRDYADGAEGLEHLTPSEAAGLVPILRDGVFAAAILERDAQDIDVDRMLQGYTRLLKARGGVVTCGARVETMRRAGDVWIVETPADAFQAPVVVNAAGAWAGAVAALAGAQAIPVTPCRRSAALLPAPAEGVMDWPLFGSVSETWYAKPDAGRLMVSPADADPVEPHDAWPDDMVLAEGLDRYERSVTVPVTRVERSWAGLRSFAPDKTPVVGFDRQAEGLFWLAGQGGYGIQTAPALAQIACALVTGQEAGEVAQALSPTRF